MIIKVLRFILKDVFKLPCLVNKDFDNSIIIEYFFKDERKLTIDLLPLLPISNFVLYKKYKGKNNYYRFIEIYLFWIYIYYIY